MQGTISYCLILNFHLNDGSEMTAKKFFNSRRLAYNLSKSGTALVPFVSSMCELAFLYEAYDDYLGFVNVSWCFTIYDFSAANYFLVSFQISEVVNCMKDLIDYSKETRSGPMGKLRASYPLFNFTLLVFIFGLPGPV